MSLPTEGFLEFRGRLASVTTQELHVASRVLTLAYQTVLSSSPSCQLLDNNNNNNNDTRPLWRWTNLTLSLTGPINNNSLIAQLPDRPFLVQFQGTLECFGCNTNSTLFPTTTTAASSSLSAQTLRQSSKEEEEQQQQQHQDVSIEYRNGGAVAKKKKSKTAAPATTAPATTAPTTAPPLPSPTRAPVTAAPTTMAPSASLRIRYLPCPTECNGPPISAFVSEVNTVLDALVANQTLQGITALSGNDNDNNNNSTDDNDGDSLVVELEPQTECLEQPFTEFEATVLLDFIVQNDTESLQPNEQRVLELAFMESYNGIKLGDGSTCDPFFRSLTNVQLDNQDTSFNRRQLFQSPKQQQQQQQQQGRSLLQTIQVNTTNNNATFNNVSFNPLIPLTFRYRLTGRCNGCRRDLQLFDEGSRRRRRRGRQLLQQKDPSNGLTKPQTQLPQRLRFMLQSQSPEDLCVCPANPQEERGPSREEFRSTYSDTVTALVEEGILEVDLQVGEELAEVTPVDCPARVGGFNSSLFVQLVGFPTNFVPEEIEALEQLFVLVYNTLVQSFCDPFFRTLQSTRIVEFLDENGNPLDLNALNPNEPITFLVGFDTVGRCRGCSPNSNLFDNTNRLLKQSEDEEEEEDDDDRHELFWSRLDKQRHQQQHHHHHHRRLEQDKECFCDLLALESERPPTEAEFQQLYTVAVSRFELPSILGVGPIDEPNPTASPSSSPSTSSPTVFDQDLLDSLSIYSVDVDAALGGDPLPEGQTPLYRFDSLPNNGTNATVEGERVDGSGTVTLVVSNVLFDWDQDIAPRFQDQVDNATANFAAQRQFRAELLNSTLSGSNGTLPLAGLLVSYLDDAGNTVVQLFPFSALDDPNFFPQLTTTTENGRKKKRKLLPSRSLVPDARRTPWESAYGTRSDSTTEYSTWDGRWLLLQEEEQLSNSCDSFVADAIANCTGNGQSLFPLNQPCLVETEREHTSRLVSIEAARQAFAVEARNLRQDITVRRAVLLLVGIIECLSSSSSSSSLSSDPLCLSQQIGQANQLIVNELVALDTQIEDTTANFVAQETMSCVQAQTHVQECFECTSCHVGAVLSDVECCTDADCSTESFFCASHVCLASGDLSFALEWVGQDNLDLTVGTAPTGVFPFFVARTDPRGSFGKHTEAITYGGTSSSSSMPLRNGFFHFAVSSNDNDDGLNDAWVLTVRERGVVVMVETGTALQSFGYVYRAQPVTQSHPSQAPFLAPI